MTKPQNPELKNTKILNSNYNSQIKKGQIFQKNEGEKAQFWT